ncbi:hypothetical protein [Halosimplex halobium]|uniref:hypothetical protein n=1 Tax=Halosimplex halobium TaxID=3396618 RepID=UPI003F5550B4
MTRNESSTDADMNRRTVLQTVGATGIGMIGIGSLVGVAGAKDEDDEKTTCAPNVGCDFRIGISVDMIETDYAGGDSLCEDIGEACTIYTAASLADPIPGDVTVVVASCAIGGGSCLIYDEFKEIHGNQNADLMQAQESGGEIEEGDYIMIPSDWN